MEAAVLAQWQDGAVRCSGTVTEQGDGGLRLWPVHTGGMDKLLAYPCPVKESLHRRQPTNMG